jgi:hypothetical protein
MKTIDDVMRVIFFIGRPKRSQAYIAGCRTALRHKLDKVQKVIPLFEEGTAEFDAWIAGYEEGRNRSKGFEYTIHTERYPE